MAVKHLLILGGTAEARELARRVAITIPKKVRVTTSLAGRRAKAPALPGDVRIGGFGGIDGISPKDGKLAHTETIDLGKFRQNVVETSNVVPNVFQLGPNCFAFLL